MKRLLITSLLLTGVVLSPLCTANAENERNLPKVLIIGDSISRGYTPHVAQMLQGKAEVRHHAGNAKHTGFGLNKIDQWIGKTKWDVIHFNWGLWDLCYRHPKSKVQGKRDKENGTLTTSLEQYGKNLEELVTRLKETDAILIWANTTIVPEGEAGRKVGDDKRYNDVASQVMKKHKIITNDLYSKTKTFSRELFARPGDVHYTDEGYRQIAKQVSQQVLAAIRGQQLDARDQPSAGD